MIFWWLIGVCYLARSYYCVGSFFSSFFFCLPCTKYHKLVWYICRKRNFFRIQHYSFIIFPFDYGHGVWSQLSWYFTLEVNILRLSLSFFSSSLMLWQWDLDSLPNISCKKDLGVRGFISWSEEFQSAFILIFEFILPFSILVMMSLIAGGIWCFAIEVVT